MPLEILDHISGNIPSHETVTVQQPEVSPRASLSSKIHRSPETEVDPRLQKVNFGMTLSEEPGRPVTGVVVHDAYFQGICPYMLVEGGYESGREFARVMIYYDNCEQSIALI